MNEHDLTLLSTSILSHRTKMPFLLKALLSIRRLHNPILSGQCVLSWGSDTVSWSEMCVNVRLGPPHSVTVHISAHWQHVNHIRPINAGCFLLSVGSGVRTKTLWAFECQHPLPLISSLSCVSMCSLVAFTYLFWFYCLLWCTVIANLSTTVMIIIHRDFVRLFLALCGLFSGVCVQCGVFCFVLLCRESECVCSASRWTEDTHSQAHTDSKCRGINLSGRCFFAKSRLEVDKSQLSSHKAIWDVDLYVQVGVGSIYLL